MLYTPDLSFYLAMAAVHIAFFWCFLNLRSAMALRLWGAALQGVCLLVIGAAIYQVYAVIPALWWPGGRPEFFRWVGWAGAPFLVSQVLAFRLAALKTSKPGPHAYR